MIDAERLLTFSKDELQEASKDLSSDDINQLVEWLSLKDDKIRYQSLLLLQSRSAISNDVYQFFNVFRDKLKNENSYQRSIGIMLIADNIKWDVENRFDGIIDDYLNVLNDEKPITVRQCIQSLSKILPYKKNLQLKIADSIMAVNISDIRETMRKSVMTDILNILIMIREYRTSDNIDKYIFDALSGGVLDKKTVKQIKAVL